MDIGDRAVLVPLQEGGYASVQLVNGLEVGDRVIVLRGNDGEKIVVKLGIPEEGDRVVMVPLYGGGYAAVASSQLPDWWYWSYYYSVVSKDSAYPTTSSSDELNGRKRSFGSIGNTWNFQKYTTQYTHRFRLAPPSGSDTYQLDAYPPPERTALNPLTKLFFEFDFEGACYEDTLVTQNGHYNFNDLWFKPGVHLVEKNETRSQGGLLGAGYFNGNTHTATAYLLDEGYEFYVRIAFAIDGVQLGTYEISRFIDEEHPELGGNTLDAYNVTFDWLKGIFEEYDQGFPWIIRTRMTLIRARTTTNYPQFNNIIL